LQFLNVPFFNFILGLLLWIFRYSSAIFFRDRFLLFSTMKLVKSFLNKKKN